MNEERTIKVEKELSRYLIKRRIILLISFFFFLIMGIAFSLIREASKEITVHGEGFLSFESVTYNNSYVIGIVIGFMAALVFFCILSVDIIYCRVKSTEANGHCISVYRGMSKCSVYIDGEEKERIGMLSLTNVIDTKLPDGTKISIAFVRSAYAVAHISFSDNNPSIDL